MQLKLGQKVEIDDIVMTCMEIRKNFNGTIYNLQYFNGGNLIGLNYSWKELKAMGAVILLDKK